MLKDITLGQYFPGESFLHRRDPRIKIVASVLYIVTVFLCGSLFSYGLLILATLALMTFSSVPLRVYFKGLKPLAFILIFTTVYQLFFHEGDRLLFDLGFAEIYLEGVLFALVMAVRIVALLIGASVMLTYTTSPIMLTDGLERLLSPLKTIRLPVHEFAMMMTIALRFIPTLIEETDKIMSAQKARGADFASGSLIRRVKALVPVLIPLFISAFHRAGDLAVAMECRCYRGGNGRTRMTKLILTGGDFVLLLLLVGLAVAILLINRFVPGMTI